MAQGANSSLEDAATLGALLSHVHDREQLSPALALYDAIRRPRVDQLVRETFAQGKEHHLPDGPEQQQRDARLARSWMPEHGPRSGEPWYAPTRTVLVCLC
jgi:salicylate hydroxylase